MKHLDTRSELRCGDGYVEINHIDERSGKIISMTRLSTEQFHRMMFERGDAKGCTRFFSDEAVAAAGWGRKILPICVQINVPKQVFWGSSTQKSKDAVDALADEWERSNPGFTLRRQDITNGHRVDSEFKSKTHMRVNVSAHSYDSEIIETQTAKDEE